MVLRYEGGLFWGSEEEKRALAEGSRGYVGMGDVVEGSVEIVSDEGGEDGEGGEGDAEGGKGKKRFNRVRFKLYHDIKISMPPNFIGQKQSRVGNIWEEGEDDGVEGTRRRLCMTLTNDFPIPFEGKEYRAEAAWRKRS